MNLDQEVPLALPGCFLPCRNTGNLASLVPLVASDRYWILRPDAHIPGSLVSPLWPGSRIWDQSSVPCPGALCAEWCWSASGLGALPALDPSLRLCLEDPRIASWFHEAFSDTHIWAWLIKKVNEKKHSNSYRTEFPGVLLHDAGGALS